MSWYILVHVCCVHVSVHAMVHMWESEDNFVELVFTLQLYMDSRNQTQVLTNASPSEPPPWPQDFSLK